MSAHLAGSAPRAHRHTLVYFTLVLLFPFHPSILEPYLDLTFSETQGMRYLNSPSAGQVAIEVELLLKLQGLVASVGLAPSFTLCNGQWKIS